MIKEAINQVMSYLSPEPHSFTDGSGDRQLVLTKHQRLVKIEADQPPAYIVDNIYLSRLGSYVTYLNKFGNSDTLVKLCTGDKDAFQVKSTIDYHGEESPGRALHKANLRIIPTIEYTEIVGGIGKEMTQALAVRYLEKIQHMVSQPKDDDNAPTAADIGVFLRNLAITANKSASIKTDTDGNVQNLKYESNNAPQTAVPEYFVVGCKVFDELDYVGIRVVPSVKVSDEGKVSITFRAPALPLVWRDETEQLKQQLTEALTADLNVPLYE